MLFLASLVWRAGEHVGGKMDCRILTIAHGDARLAKTGGQACVNVTSLDRVRFEAPEPRYIHDGGDYSGSGYGDTIRDSYSLSGFSMTLHIA